VIATTATTATAAVLGVGVPQLAGGQALVSEVLALLQNTLDDLVGNSTSNLNATLSPIITNVTALEDGLVAGTVSALLADPIVGHFLQLLTSPQQTLTDILNTTLANLLPSLLETLLDTTDAAVSGLLTSVESTVLAGVQQLPLALVEVNLAADNAAIVAAEPGIASTIKGKVTSLYPGINVIQSVTATTTVSVP